MNDFRIGLNQSLYPCSGVIDEEAASSLFDGERPFNRTLTRASNSAASLCRKFNSLVVAFALAAPLLHETQLTIDSMLI